MAGQEPRDRKYMTKAMTQVRDEIAKTQVRRWTPKKIERVYTPERVAALLAKARQWARPARGPIFEWFDD